MNKTVNSYLLRSTWLLTEWDSGVVRDCLRRTWETGKICLWKLSRLHYSVFTRFPFNPYRTCTRRPGIKWKLPATSCLLIPCLWHTRTRSTYSYKVNYHSHHSLPFPALLSQNVSWLVLVLPRRTLSTPKGAHQQNSRCSVTTKSVHLFFLSRVRKVQRQSHMYEGHQCDLLGLLCANDMGGYGYFSQKWKRGT